MPRITISYRRDDSDVITGRIFDRLSAHYGRETVFRDIDSIPLGVDFRKHVNSVIDDTDIMIAVVGPKWIGPRPGQSRLDNAADPVRVEIDAALRKGVPLIPVLVLRAQMPRADQLPPSLEDFAYRNAATIDAGPGFRYAYGAANPRHRQCARGEGEIAERPARRCRRYHGAAAQSRPRRRWKMSRAATVRRAT